MPNWKKVITSGSDASLNSLNATSAFTASGIIYPISDGSNNQSLVTDGAGNLTFGNPYSDNTVVYGKNLSGTTIEKGTPLYFTGSGTTGNLVGVFPADASNPARMPAGGIAGEQMLNEAEGVVLLDGFINGVDTSAFDSGDLVYVGVGGGYTNVAPTGSSNLIQSLGYVEKIDNTNGSGVIKGPGVPRSVPNIQQGYVWVGNADDVPTPTATSSLSVASATQTSQAITFNNGGTGAVSGTTFNGSTARTISYNTIGAQPLLTNPVTGTGTTNYLPKFTGTSALGNSLVYDDATNVGIGTTSPSKNLDIRGIDPSIMIASDNSSGQASLILRGLGSNGTSNAFTEIKGIPEGVGAASSLTFDTRASSGTISEKMRITSDGNVGIGTTTPSEKLEVDGNVQIGLNSDAKLYMVSTGGNGNNERFFIEGYADGGTYGGGFKLHTRNDSNIFNPAVTVNRLGNVGIGTTSPSRALHVSDSSDAPFRVESTDSTTGIQFKDPDGSNNIYYVGNGDYFYTSANVGIGTTSPSRKLQVEGGDFYTSDKSDTIGASVGYGGNSFQIRNGSTSEDLNFDIFNRTTSAWGTPFVIKNSGNVGIGTNNPATVLDVAGGGTAIGSTGYSYNARFLEGSENVGVLIGHNNTSNGNGMIAGVNKLAFLTYGTAWGERMIIDGDGSIQFPAYGAGFLTTDASGNVSVSAGSGTSSDTLDDVTGRGNTTTNSIEVGDIKSTGDITIDNSSGDPFLKFKTTAQEYVVRIDQSDSEKFQIRDTTNNETRLTLDTSGNVGIGTTSPTRELEVTGAGNTYIKISTNSDTDFPALELSNTFAGKETWTIANFDTNNSLNIYNTGGTKAVITADGNVGIGTTDPNAKLQVGPGTTNQQSQVASIGSSVDGLTSVLSLVNQQGDNSDGNGVSIDFHNADNWSATGRISVIQPTAATGTSTNSSMQFSTYGTVGTTTTFEPRMTIDYQGNVGIGTDSPDNKLHLNVGGQTGGFKLIGNSSSYTAAFISNTGSGNAGIYFDAINGDISGNDYGFIGQNDSGYMLYNIGPSSPMPYHVLTGGNVGIGTTSPTAKLHVLGTSTGDATTKAEMLSNSVFSVRPHATNSGTLAIAQVDGGNSVGMQFTNGAGTSNWDISLQPFGGNVGIGTTSPSKKFSVDGGSIKLNNNNAAANYYLWLNKKEGWDGGILLQRDNNLDWQITNLNTSGDLNFYSYGGPASVMRIQRSTGNVGIGTTSPNAKLEVKTPSYNAANAVANFINGNNPVRVSYDTVVVAQTDVPTLSIVETIDGSQANEQKLTFSVGDNKAVIASTSTATDGMYFNVNRDTDAPGYNTGNGITALNIKNNGNVGIGTNSPNAKLHIGPDSLISGYTPDRATLAISDTTDGGQLIIRGQSPRIWLDGTAGGNGEIYLDNTNLTFQSGNPTSLGSSTMYLKSDGNVGIGTTSPSYKLDVSGSGRFSGPINAEGGLYFRGDANMGFIPYPIGGQLRSDLSPATGYVMIKLPTDIGNQPDDMISFHVDLYDYTTNEMISVYIGGYVYTNGSGGGAYWYNCTSIITTKEDDKDFNVRFGWDGTNYYVAIGETTSTWQHPSIIVRDFQCSYRGAIEHYIDGWDVSIGTSALVGVDETQSGNLPKASSASLSTASSLYDLIPNGAFTTTYAFTSTAGTWAEVMEGNDVITSTGTYSVQVFVDDYGVGGTQYDEYYSGTMSWFATGTNDTGDGAISEITLHRAGHAANSGVIYLRTRETTNAETNKLKLEVMSNKTYTGASNLIFKFVRLI